MSQLAGKPVHQTATDAIWASAVKALAAGNTLGSEFAGARPFVLLLLMMLLGALLLLSLALGSASIPFEQVVGVLL